MGRPRNHAKRTTKIATPASEDELKAWKDACKKVKCEPADTLRKMVEAFCETVNEAGYIVIPFKFVGESARRKPKPGPHS